MLLSGKNAGLFGTGLIHPVSALADDEKRCVLQIPEEDLRRNPHEQQTRP